MPGGIDTGAIRRSWPDVLAKIATTSRVTWSFVSQNTRVLDYNGERLLLGLSTDGLLSTLRGKNHAEVVRQALIEVIGVDTRVEGMLSTDAASADLPAADPGTPAPQDRASAPQSTPDESVSDESVSHESAEPVRAPTPERPSTPRQRARAAVAQEASRRNTRSSSSVADDSVVSADDEDIDDAGATGQPVIERVLGGIVIGELEQ
ncbi:MAG: hypothetical protein IMZ75_04965 [Actinobacteria bacterium]|nr:hypothetical protein [Actinomycetota bacterium]